MSVRALLKADDITIFKLLENGKEISDALALYKNLVGAEEDWKARENCTRRASAVELESWRNGARKLNSAG